MVFCRFGRNTFNTKQEVGITFQQLKNGKVGDEFTANPNPEDECYMNDTARILYVDDESVLVRVTENVRAEEGENSFTHIEHILLF